MAEDRPLSESIVGWVDCRVIESRGDTSDADKMPDVRGVPGKVVFSPTSKVVRGSYADGHSAYILRRDVPALFDEDGWLWTADPDTGEPVQRKVPLVAGTYAVTFQVGAAITRENITVTADNTEDNPLDLVDAFNSPEPGATVQAVQLPAMTGQAGKFMGTDGNKLVWLASAVRVTVASTRVAADGEQPSVTADADNRLSFVLPPGTPGDPGHSPVVTMQGDQLSIDGKVTGPHLTGPASTVPGPPNVLSIGTVTTGAADSNASASITGTAPNQTLSLTIPQGAAGPSGGPIPAGGTPGQTITPLAGGGYGWVSMSDSATIIAAGRPDITSSMDTAAQAKVAAAPVGTVFRSTDGAGVGAWAWCKRPTNSWVVVDGDTGWCDISALFTSAVTGGTLKVRRYASSVALNWADVTTDSTNGDRFLTTTWPSGFLPTGNYYDAFLLGTSTRGRFDIMAGSLRAGSPSANWRVRDLQLKPCAQSWPAARPGPVSW